MINASPNSPNFPRRILRRLMLAVARRDLPYRCFEKTAGWFSDYLRICRRQILLQRQLLDESRLRFVYGHLPALTVAQGPFRGMRYPCAQAVGSALVPKLTGSYECELHTIIENIVRQNYRMVVDVGCAEGYYAVGLAIRLPQAVVVAFDTNAEATELCRRMAEMNGVADRILTGGWCDSLVLSLMTSGGRSLIICDTEGYEKTLFSDSLVPSLAPHDILVETHDFVHRGITELLRNRFSATHDIIVIESLTDEEKSRTFASEVLDRVTEAERIDLVSEGRPEIMKWLWMRSRVAGESAH